MALDTGDNDVECIGILNVERNGAASVIVRMSGRDRGLAIYHTAKQAEQTQPE